jgi:hypothetical protein
LPPDLPAPDCVARGNQSRDQAADVPVNSVQDNDLKAGEGGTDAPTHPKKAVQN